MPTEIIKHEQPVRDLVEFAFIAVPVEGLPQTYDLNAELRLGASEVDESATSEAFTIRLRRIFVELEYSGVNIAPGTKYAEPLAKNEVKTALKFSKNVELEIKGGAKAEGNAGGDNMAASAAANAALAAQRKTTCIEETQYETTKMRVKAIGNDRWEVTEIDGSSLDGKIINNERLCRVTQKDKSNAVLIGGRVLAKQRDFKFDLSKFKRLTNNDKKLLAVFLSKKLAGGRYSGEIPLAELQIGIT